MVSGAGASATSAGSSERSASGWKRFGLHGVARRAWSRVTAASGMTGRVDALGQVCHGLAFRRARGDRAGRPRQRVYQYVKLHINLHVNEL
jgi:hypothetical protein